MLKTFWFLVAITASILYGSWLGDGGRQGSDGENVYHSDSNKDTIADIIAQRRSEDFVIRLPESDLLYELESIDFFCLYKNIYHEAGVEDIEGKYAVAQVTINRVLSDRFPNTICDVVMQPYQFSWANDRSVRWERYSGPLWDESIRVARDVLFSHARVPSLGESLFYHRKDVSPNWSHPRYAIQSVGVHRFYRNDLKR